MINLFSNNDKSFLNLSVEQAQKAFDLGNYPVGAVLVVDGRMLGSEENKIIEASSDIEHAELRLISSHAKELKAAFKAGSEISLYSTLEPCLQCLGVSVMNHINKIVYITKDPHAGACSLIHDNIGVWYKQRWPKIIYAPISEKPINLMMQFFNNEIKKGNKSWPEKMIRLYKNYSISFICSAANS